MVEQTGGITETLVQNAAAPPQVVMKAKLPKKVQFTEGTVDNEHFGLKKSKVCCIYHKPKDGPDDSSSCSSDSDSEGPNAYERIPKHKKKGCNHHKQPNPN